MFMILVQPSLILLNSCIDEFSNISASNITNSSKYEDVVDKVTVIDDNFSTLQSYPVSN